MKKQIIAAVIAIVFTNKVFATEVIITENLPVLNIVELQTAFQQDGQPIQTSSLSRLEMRNTEGALGPIAVAGVMTLTGGMAGVAYNRYTTGSWGGSGVAFATGAVAGLYATPLPVGTVGLVVQYGLGVAGTAATYNALTNSNLPFGNVPFTQSTAAFMNLVAQGKIGNWN